MYRRKTKRTITKKDKVMITVKIDTTLLDKSLMYKSEKTGKTYLDLVLKEYKDGASKYGDSHFVIQSASKEHNAMLKAKGERMPIIGNAKEWAKRDGGWDEGKSQKASGPFTNPESHDKF